MSVHGVDNDNRVRQSPPRVEKTLEKPSPSGRPDPAPGAAGSAPGPRVDLASDAYQRQVYLPVVLSPGTPGAAPSVPVAPPAAQVRIDPRLEARGDLQIVPRTSGPNGTLDVVAVTYQDDQQSGGNHNVFVRVLDANGNEIPPDQLAQWFDVRYVPGEGQPESSGCPKLNDPCGVAHDAWTDGGATGGGPSTSYFDVPLWGGNRTQIWLVPKDVPGNPYAGYGTQQVGPLYMPGNHHVSYLVTFQAVPAGAGVVTPPPVEPPPVESPPSQPPPAEGAAARIAAYAQGKDIGQPQGAAVTLPGGATMQRYTGGGATEGECAVVDSVAGGTQLVKNAFYRTYVQADNAARLGAPVGEEGWVDGAYVQRFEHGTMTWENGQVTVRYDAPAAPAQAGGNAAAAGGGGGGGDSKLAELLAQNPGIKTNQDLINYFYRVGGNAWAGASAAAATYGVDLMALTRDRSAPVSGAAPVQPAPGQAPADLGSMVEGVYQEVLGRASDPGGKANWVNFAAGQRAQGRSDAEIRSTLVAMFKQSDEYLRKNPVGPVQPPPPPQPADLGGMVEGVYQEVLGRASDPGGKAMWVRWAEGQRARGKTDAEIRAGLVAQFRQSDEYRAKNPTGPTGPGPIDPTGPGPVGAAGSVYAPLEIAPGVQVNGRLGFHWRNDMYDTDMVRAQQIIDRAKALGCGYCTLLVDPGNPEANAQLIAKLQQNGITPVVRMYLGAAPDTWSDQDIARMAECAQKLAGMGVKLIQVGNEPNLEAQLNDRGMLNPQGWQQYLERSCARQAEALLAIKRAVGDSAMIGIPPVGCGCPDKVEWGCYAPETYFPALLRAIKSVEVANDTRIVDWIPTHTYDMDTPGTGHSPDTARGHLGWGPATSTWYEDQVAAILGRRMHSLSTEGGAEPNAFRSDPGRTDALMRESMDALNANRTLTNCLWLLYDDSGMASGNWGSWNKIALWDGEGNWGPGLDAYRRAYDEARGG